MAGETTESIRIEREGITASLLVWQRFRRPMPGTVERLYELNPGIAEGDAFLPVGAVVLIPIPAVAANNDIAPIRLWG